MLYGDAEWQSQGWSHSLKEVLQKEWLGPALKGCKSSGGSNGTSGDGPRDIAAIIADLELLVEGAPAEHEKPPEDPDEYDDRDETKEIRSDLAAIFRAGTNVSSTVSSVRIWGSEPYSTCEGLAELLDTPDLWSLTLDERARFATAATRKWKASKIARLQQLLSKVEEADAVLRAAAAGNAFYPQESSRDMAVSSERIAWVASNFVVTALTITRSAMDKDIISHLEVNPWIYNIRYLSLPHRIYNIDDLFQPHIVIVEEAAEVLEVCAAAEYCNALTLLTGKHVGRTPDWLTSKAASGSADWRSQATPANH